MQNKMIPLFFIKDKGEASLLNKQLLHLLFFYVNTLLL